MTLLNPLLTRACCDTTAMLKHVLEQFPQAQCHIWALAELQLFVQPHNVVKGTKEVVGLAEVALLVDRC